MKKRTLINSLGAITAIATPIFAVVSCASHTTYEVPIDNTKDKNYVIAIPDINYQPIPYAKNKTIFWDISSKFKGPKYNKALNDFFKNDSGTVILATKEGKPYKNGLEWFIYELLLAKDHGIDLNLNFHSKQDIDIKSQFPVNDNVKKSITDSFDKKGKLLLKIEKEINTNSNKTSEDMIKDLLGKYSYNSGNGINTLDDLKSHFNNKTLKDVSDYINGFNAEIETQLSSNKNDKLLSASKLEWSYKAPAFIIPKSTMKSNADDRAKYLKSKNLEFIHAFWNVELITYDQTKNVFNSKPISKIIFDKAVDDMLSEINKK